MTEQEISALCPAFAAYLRRFQDNFGQDRTAGHFDTNYRGLISLPNFRLRRVVQLQDLVEPPRPRSHSANFQERL